MKYTLILCLLHIVIGQNIQSWDLPLPPDPDIDIVLRGSPNSEAIAEFFHEVSSTDSFQLFEVHVKVILSSAECSVSIYSLNVTSERDESSIKFPRQQSSDYWFSNVWAFTEIGTWVVNVASQGVCHLRVSAQYLDSFKSIEFSSPSLLDSVKELSISPYTVLDGNLIYAEDAFYITIQGFSGNCQATFHLLASEYFFQNAASSTIELNSTSSVTISNTAYALNWEPNEAINWVAYLFSLDGNCTYNISGSLVEVVLLQEGTPEIGTLSLVADSIAFQYPFHPGATVWRATLTGLAGECNIFWGYGGLAQTNKLETGSQFFFNNWDETMPLLRHYRILANLYQDPTEICKFTMEINSGTIANLTLGNNEEDTISLTTISKYHYYNPMQDIFSVQFTTQTGGPCIVRSTLQMLNQEGYNETTGTLEVGKSFDIGAFFVGLDMETEFAITLEPLDTQCITAAFEVSVHPV